MSVDQQSAAMERRLRAMGFSKPRGNDHYAIARNIRRLEGGAFARMSKPEREIRSLGTSREEG